MSTIAAPAALATAGAGLARWRVLVGAVIVQLILGTVYGYSIFWQPLQAEVFPKILTRAEASQIIQAGGSAAGFTIVADDAARKVQQDVQQGHLKYAFSLCILSFAVVMVLAGRVQDAKGPRFTALIGAALMGGGFLTAGLMSSPAVFYLAHAAFVGAVGLVLLTLFDAFFGRLGARRSPAARHAPLAIMSAVTVAGIALANSYVGRSGEIDRLFLLWGTVGFLAGAGIGFAYVCPIAALAKWFPNAKGLVLGIAVAGFGFGAYLFSSKDLPFGATSFIESHGITRFFIVHGLVCLAAVSAGALMLSNPPSTPARAPQEAEWQEMLRRPAFYLLWPMFFSGALAGLTVIGILKDFAGEQLVAMQPGGGAGLDEAARRALMLQGAAAVGLLSIFNAVGRIGWGLLSDRVGRTTAFVAMFLLQAATMFLLPGMRTEAMLGVAACLVGFNFGGCFALFPSATADLFGAKNLGANYGLVFTAYGIAGVVGVAAGNTARVLTGSYTAAFALAGALCLLSAGMALVLGALQKREARAAA